MNTINIFLNTTKSIIAIALLLFSIHSNAGLIRHDFRFAPKGGGGTGHSVIFDGRNEWSGYIEYDLDHSDIVSSGASTQYNLHDGFGRMFIDFGVHSFTVEELSINFNPLFRETLYMGRLTSGFLLLPELPEDRYKVGNWVLTDFRFNLNSMFGTNWSNGLMNAAGPNWGYLRTGLGAVSGGYIPAPEDEAPVSVDEPNSIWLLTFTLIGLICLKRKQQINP